MYPVWMSCVKFTVKMGIFESVLASRMRKSKMAYMPPSPITPGEKLLQISPIAQFATAFGVGTFGDPAR